MKTIKEIVEERVNGPKICSIKYKEECKYWENKCQKLMKFITESPQLKKHWDDLAKNFPEEDNDWR